ncbi:hypothetical protein CGCF415_v012756 [Colletotrichum fructicola]|uniref:Thioesterase domain-containing protein n=1 Tax=Colletotrichum fructicola (strain Nara gc5) TaxID=1213859 RepID=A0A7J6IWU4_COLFN|nr:uncharacterized protein CGMCC3_g5623 [Colletotrichum fructicola]KAF4481533.1 hypothetical protein CGGC5_v011362 [Colletotrichum fructicola Nara gc5]KAE9578387.1 hypothetical protein CGMCC3_g5623 [Colletotrichum fructicola]KAF4426234.1 hypothetical protein CFRS1_v009944 [Colletotrichum fructicola]KAF4885815.1 hypothetical protein CGCFRS4_v011650 [Colletotrichum fructicola]KAF4893345.1 hypothetical protein CGCF415_v012756 [Colletotrichum fructicola]
MSDPAYADQIAYFNTIPWVSATLSEPGLISMPPITRHFDPSLRASEFWGVTLHSKATIPYFIGCFHPPPSSTPSDSAPLEERYIAHVRFFLKLSHGLSTLERERVHGGVVASIFDECAGAVGFVNKMYGRMEMLPHVTRTLELEYRRAVPVGAVVGVVARLVKVEERTFVVEMEMVDEEGVVLARAEAGYVVLEKKGRKGKL